MQTIQTAVEAASAQVNTESTPAQAEAGTEPSDGGAGAAGDSRGGGENHLSKRGDEGVQEVYIGLEDSEADDFMARMESNATATPKIELNPTTWKEQFGDDGKVVTPVGEVKMGANQIAKLFEKGRSEQFGMIRPTLESPLAIIEVPSEATDGKAERGTSLLFVKTFIGKNGEKVYYFKSVTVKKDGMEVSVSSHYDRPKRIKDTLKKGKLLYRFDGGAQTEQRPADVSVTVSPEDVQGISERKVTNSASEKQESGEESFAQRTDNKEAQTIQTAVEAASAQVNTEPTPAQAEAGNYRKGHVSVAGFEISIENPAGSTRKGVDADGKAWSTTMANAYGDIKGTESKDGDPIDVFLHTDMDSWDGRKVFVVDQTNTDGTFDEHKVMLGFNSAEEALAAYFANYDETWAQTHPGIRISETGVEDVRKWTQSSHRKTKAFADYKSVKPILYDNQGNPIDENGNLIIENVKSIADITDVDFSTPTRTVGLPALPAIVQKVLSTSGKRVIIKKNIFERNAQRHDELTPDMSRAILSEALYNPNLYGKNKPLSRPNNWIVINVPDGKGNNKLVVLEVNESKDNVEIVHWHEADERGLKKIKRQAEREDGQLLILPSETSEEAGALSGPTFDSPSDGKVNDSASEKQENGAESFVQGKALRPIAEPYNIAPKPYTNKQGRTLDTYLVTFDRDFSKEEMSALRAKAKAVKGWYDRESGGWMLRSVEDAKAFAEDVAGKSEDDVADEAPLSMSDMEKPADTAVKKVNVGSGADALKQKGETKLSDHADPLEQPTPKKRRWISDEDADEFDSLRNDLRNHFGKGDDIVQESAEGYGKPQPKPMAAEVLRMGTRMTYLMMKGGLRSFSDYCEAMKDELPDIFDEMRPHLKSLYAAAQNMEEVMQLGWDEEMDDRKTVKAFDVYNFDKPGAKDIIATAQHTVDERESQKQTDQIIQTLKEKRNERRKKEADETSADTEAIAGKAEAVAGEVGSKLETATTERDAERLTRDLDREIEEVNKQLALLGYYEADPVDKDFNEAYGYMRNAEKKATADAVATLTGNKSKKSRKKDVTLKPEQPIGDLFGGLFDNTQNSSNHEGTEMGTRPGEAGGQRQQLKQDTQVGGDEPRRETERPAGEAGSGSTGMDSDADRTGSRGLHDVATQPALERLPEKERKNVHNNHVERGTEVAPKSESARIKANIAAIETMKKLEVSGEAPTAADMKKLRAFSGWGGLGKAFSDWDTSRQLRQLLGDKLYDEGAEMSRNSAYFTPAYIVDAMWDIARAMGFKGGRVLEGSAGIGNVLGLMPQDLSERSYIRAVEKDPTTGKMLSLLYPDAVVDIDGFEKVKIVTGTYDLVITNVPFVPGLKVADTSGDGDISKEFKTSIHDFCIAKNVRKLRDGGVGVFITTAGSMDGTGRLHKWLSNRENADIVGMFRMHNETFGGTNATSDIIVVRKRVNGIKSPHAIDCSLTTGVRTAEYDTGEKKKIKDVGEVPIIKTLSMSYNRYYVEHPEYMAGEMHFGFEKGDTSFRPESKGLYPIKEKDQSQLLSQWVEDMKQKLADTSEEPAPTVMNHRDEYVPTYDKVGNEVKTGTVVVDSQGRICVNYDGTARPLMSNLDNKNPKSADERIAQFNKNKVKGRTRAQVVQDYNAIKKALNDLLEYQKSSESDEGLQPKLKALNRAFDSFVATYGHLHGNNGVAWLKNDVDYPSVIALETYREEGLEHKKVFGKADIFSRRVVVRPEQPKATNVRDGVTLSIRQTGSLDPRYIAEQLGMSEADVRREVIEAGLGYENPLTHSMEAAHEYLSGNVREKMQQAEANNEDGRYTPNITALRKVVPHNIPSHFIEFSIGSSWLRPELFEQYVKERTGASVKLTYAGGMWAMDKPKWSGEQDKSFGIRSEICDKIITGTELIEAAMTNRTIRVSKQQKDGSTISDPKATSACAAKVDEIRDDFKSWLRTRMESAPELAKEIEETYNNIFNNSAPMTIPDEYIPEYFDGAARVIGGKPIKMRKHQSKAIVRGTMQSLMLAHEVGTGKTFTLITTAMEMRRLGTAKKPMIVVQNATLGQFVASAKALYPDARILSLEDKDRNAEGRKDFYAKIRYNDWDMVVIPQSVLERIPDHPDRERRFIEESIQEKMDVIEAMSKDRESGRAVAALKKDVENLRDRLNKLSDIEAAEDEVTERVMVTSGSKPKKDGKRAAIAKENAKTRAEEMLNRATDDTLNFDDLGVDAILVDEAHEYKHLGFATAMQRGVKGVDPSYSKKCQGLYLKVKAVQEKSGGRNVIFATGTPISNTAAEVWTFMRYLLPREVMEDHNIWYFDDFVRNFGSIQQMLEFTTQGTYKENNRFAGYSNLPELARIWAGITDTVLTAEAGEVKSQIPELEGGQPTDLYLPQTNGLRAVLKFVRAQLKAYDEMSGQEKKENSHIPLVMYGIAKAAAIDARLVMANAPDDPHSKTNEAVRQVLRSLEDSKAYNGTVAIFADNYQRKNKGTGAVEFNLFDDIRTKLIAQGVPAEQVVIMRDGMTDKAKEKIFAKVNAGEIRVILGTTQRLGVGVNIQERLHTLMHIDAPNRPMDYWQRMGRLLRQGNLHKEMGSPVRVIRFGVEDSLDVTAYQRLKTKGAIADAIMHSKDLLANNLENRILEEEGDEFGNITAELSGSQYAMLQNQTEKELRKLQAKQDQHRQHQMYIHRVEPKLREQIEKFGNAIMRSDDILALLENNPTTITINGKTYQGREDMQKVFEAHNKAMAAKKQSVQQDEPITSTLTFDIGNVHFTLTTHVSQIAGYGGQGALSFDVDVKHDVVSHDIDYKRSFGDIPLKRIINELVDNVISGKEERSNREAWVNAKERNETDLAILLKDKGKPFEHGERIKELERKLEEYTTAMQEELREKEAKYAEMDKDVEAASGVELTEEDSEYAASEPIASYSEENANFASRYETADGKTIRYTSENPEGYEGLSGYDLSGENRGSDAVGSRSGFDHVQRERSATLAATHGGRLNRKAGEYCNVERVFTESGSFKFTSGERIESAADVAFIFSALEDAAVEHTFAVYVKDGVPTVVELGMGSFNASIANSGPAYLAYTRIKPDEVYFVHNHPSGNLKCSAPDVRLLKQFQEMCEVPVHGVIINLKTGKYGTFDTDNNMGVGDKRIPEKEYPLTLHKLDKQIFAPDYDPMAQPLVRSSHDVASFVNSHRMGDRAKMSFLVISQSGGIVGNMHTPFTEIPAEVDELARYISERVIQFGGMSAIVYGDFSGENNRKSLRVLRERMKQLGGVNLLDVMRIEGKFTFSANDEGLFYEPGSEYGASPDSGIRFREVERINAWQQEMAQTSAEAKSSHAERLSKKFNTPVRIVGDAKELTNDNAERQALMRRSKGFYDPASGEVVIVLSNNATVEDVAETVFHEVVAHKGLREMIGEENYDAFCDEVYDHLKDDLKQQVDEDTTRRFINEPGKGYEYHRHVAVDELFGRMAEKGFEDFTKAERGIWAKLKAKVLEAINKFLGSLKLPKWVTLGDNELRYMLWRSHERLRTKGDYVEMARDAAKREELGLRRNEAVRVRKSSEIVTADRIERMFDKAVAGDLKGKPVEVGRLTKEGREYLERLSGLTLKENISFVLNPSDLVHMYRDHFGNNEKDKGSNIPLTKDDIRAIADVVSHPERVIFGIEPDGLQRKLFYFLAPANEGAYNLLEIYGDRKGNLTAKTFYKTRKGVSQRVLSLMKSEHLTSATDGATLSDDAKLPKFFDSPTIAEEERLEYRFRDGETGDIWKDQSVGLEERITNAAIRLSANQSGDLTLRNDAMRAVTNNLQSLLHTMRNRRGTARSFAGADRKVEAGVVDAVNAQAMYDRSTVKRVADLARILMQNGYLSGMTSGEMQRLLSAVKNATAMHDISDSVQKIMDIMVDNQLRNGEASLHQL